MDAFMTKAAALAGRIYQGPALSEAAEILARIHAEWPVQNGTSAGVLCQRDVMLIAYGDAITAPGETPLHTLGQFVARHGGGAVSNIHLLPIFPYTSDDGFSVSDYARVDTALGSWDDVAEMAGGFGVMLDAVVNHTSKSHPWFQKCLAGQEPYTRYYIESDPAADYSSVTRPRTLPLLTAFDTAAGEKWYWTTFSGDQVDLNYHCPLVLGEVLEVLLDYAAKGARFIRLDAVGFIWKQAGTTCLHLPQAHAIVKLMRLFLDAHFPGTVLITETNVPHLENIGYFGAGDEAQLVYQFPLPVLALHTLLAGDATRLSAWARSLDETPLPPGCTYFNFLASHDGVGMRPAEGLLEEAEKQRLVDTVLQNGGRVGYKQNSDGSQSPYELNIGYIDALTPPGEPDDGLRCARFMAAQGIMLSLQGMPGIYYHSLFGSRSWGAGVAESGINRRINREKLDAGQLAAELQAPGTLRHRVFREYLRLLDAHGSSAAFSPMAPQRVLDMGPAFFALRRENAETGEAVLAVVNVTGEAQALPTAPEGRDLLSGESGPTAQNFAPYQLRWLATGGQNA